MTVQDLIAYLEKLPGNTVIGVVYLACSDYTILEEDDLYFIDKEERDIIEERFQQHGGRGGRYRTCNERRYVLRNGKIMEYDEATWPPEEKPHFVPILVLPGN